MWSLFRYLISKATRRNLMLVLPFAFTMTVITLLVLGRTEPMFLVAAGFLVFVFATLVDGLTERYLLEQRRSALYASAFRGVAKQLERIRKGEPGAPDIGQLRNAILTLLNPLDPEVNPSVIRKDPKAAPVVQPKEEETVTTNPDAEPESGAVSDAPGENR